MLKFIQILIFIGLCFFLFFLELGLFWVIIGGGSYIIMTSETKGK